MRSSLRKTPQRLRPEEPGRIKRWDEPGCGQENDPKPSKEKGPRWIQWWEEPGGVRHLNTSGGARRIGDSDGAQKP